LLKFFVERAPHDAGLGDLGVIGARPGAAGIAYLKHLIRAFAAAKAKRDCKNAKWARDAEAMTRAACASMTN
jgi:hypothetical protein